MTDTPHVIDADHATRAGTQTAFDGLTVRDFFAAAALQGIISAHSGDTALPDDGKAAKWAFSAADAMLARRALRFVEPVAG